MSSPGQLLDATIKTRLIAADSLYQALSELLSSNEQISEVTLRDRWLAQLRTHSELYPDGWYMPPPHGLIINFASDADTGRLHSPSFREKATWPRDDIFLDREHGIAMLYASPVDRAAGVIGDFGTLLYFGRDRHIHEHLAKCLDLNRRIAAFVKPGLTYADVADFAAEQIGAAGMANIVISATDPAGTNIGHTIPDSVAAKSDDWSEFKDSISKKRLFVSQAETTPIPATGAFTIEPRPQVPDRPDLPMVAYHTILVCREGSYELLTNFDKLFRLAGMHYMLP